MNERIRELAKNATDYCIEEGRSEAWLWEDKFGQLVAQECIAICKKIVYESMEIKLKESGDLKEFERGMKAGRKFGSMDCVSKLTNHFKAE